jgi:hypothetical protein
MERIVVVGSGPSGVHFALSVLRKGYDVTMVDVGFAKPAALARTSTFPGLKENLDDPVRYFLGERFEGVVLPQPGREYYGIPPSKNYVFRSPEGIENVTRGFAPLFGFAQGGIAEVWTGGCYPFNDAELADMAKWPGVSEFAAPRMTWRVISRFMSIFSSRWSWIVTPRCCWPPTKKGKI